jgi:tRNA A-37 threonylcarbamoyl transferase component Bud32
MSAALASPSFWSTLFLLGGLFLMRYGRSVRLGRRSGAGQRKNGLIVLHPHYRSWLRKQGLLSPADFLTLPGVIVSGHPDRNVARVALGTGLDSIWAYLKREHVVPWMVRLRNALAGFGLVSRSLRECRLLQALQREGLACPDWMAAGEDPYGRAFLLVRESPRRVGLVEFLGGESDLRARRQVSRCLGIALARLHHAGFTHPDLYAKHVLVHQDTREIIFLDWQRARRPLLGWRGRGRDLASLNATLPDASASRRERWHCLRAYLQETRRLRTETLIPLRRTALFRSPRTAPLVAAITRAARRMLRRRHILEKRASNPRVCQDWICVGDALAVTTELSQVWPGRTPDWLTLDRQPPLPGPMARRWLRGDAGQQVLLVRRRLPNRLAALWWWVWPPRHSTEEQQAILLLRLQRLEITAPRVLARGQRRAGSGRLDSFLLTAPPSGCLRLDLWLRRQARQVTTNTGRQHVQTILHDAGALLARLHQACCYLAHPTVDQFAVQVSEGEVVLPRADAIQVCRCPRPALAACNCKCFLGRLAEAGCSARELHMFLTGYQRQIKGRPLEDGGEKRCSVAAAGPITLAPRNETMSIRKEDG